MDPFIGEIKLFGGNFAPRGWAFCEGQLMPISQWSALFSILGTIYGGDGRSTFALPDLRGRTPIGVGNGPGISPVSQGENGGANTTTLLVQNLPSHNHNVSLHAERVIADKSNPNGRMLGVQPNTSDPIFADIDESADDLPLAAQSIQQSNVGSNLPFNNMQPFIGMRYIIAMEGVYPSRS